MAKNFLKYVTVNHSYLLEQFLRHFLISFYGVLLAALLAIPLGFFIARRKRLAGGFISLANIIQTIPSLAMLSIVMSVFGLGANTVIVSVFLYSILPILKNTYVAVISVDNDLLDAAQGLGMTQQQILCKIEIPLSISVIIGGIKNAIVLAIGITTMGTFIGAGGLGDIITRGINASNGAEIIVAGAVPAALLAVFLDGLLSLMEKKLEFRSKRSLNA